MKHSSLIIGTFLLTACSFKTSDSRHLKETGKPALHAVQSERLQTLMNQLNDLMFERMLTEVELDRERRQRAQDIAATAASMLQTLNEIPETIPQLSLNAKEQQTFLSLSDRLHEHVSLLKQEAEQNYVDAIPSRLDQIVETCNACHRLFRQHTPR